MGNLVDSVVASELRSSDALTQLALDLHWSWNHSADEIWKELDLELWELTENPWLILKSVSQQKLDSLRESKLRDRVELMFEVEVSLAGIDPSFVRVELFADARDGAGPICQPMHRKAFHPGTTFAHTYSATVPATRAETEFTPRILPHHPKALPLEIDRMLWQK